MGIKAGVWGLLLLGFVNQALCETRSRKKYQSEVDFGAWVSNLSERQDAPDGFASKVSSTQGLVRYRLGIAVKKWRFEPSLLLLLPWRSGVDGTTKIYTTHLGLNGVFSLAQFLSLRVGTGVLWDRYSVTGQTLVLNNGTGSSTFYLPERTSNTFLLTVQGGFAFHLGTRWSLLTEVMVGELMDSERRRFHGMALIGVKL